MKNKVKFDKLITLLPLATPLSILIDPSNLCNFQCKFCPTGDKELLKSVNRPKGMMSYELFCKIIDDMKGFSKKIRKMDIYKDGEPFLNKDACKMIKYAKEKGVADSIQTTSNGALIDENLAIEIIESGLDVLRISVEHVSNEGYQEITRTFSDYEKIIKNIKFLFEEKVRRKSHLKIFVKILDVNLSESEKETFLKDFTPISDIINIDTLMGWSGTDKKDFTLGMDVNTGMNSENILKKDRLICPEPFKTLAINFNGEVSICCVDWAMATIVGNVQDENLIDIWNGERLNIFRKMQIQGRRKDLNACSDCQYIQGLNPLSDLDACSDELKKYYGS